VPTPYAVPVPRWPWVAGAALLIVALAVFGVTQLRSNGPAPADRVQRPAASEPAAGCLGGAEPTAAVIAAQSAPHTPTGAAEFLATYIRWQTRIPQAGEASPATVGGAVWGSDVPNDVRAAAIDRQASDSHATFVGKHYSVREVVGARVLIALTVDLADVNGAVLAHSGTVAWVELVDGKWRFDGVDKDLSQQALGDDDGAAFRATLDATGTPLVEAC
jgi:hypothetical protein